MSANQLARLDWIQLVECWFQWRDVVSMEMKLTIL